LIRIMFLRLNQRFKEGKEHRYWNIVESKRCACGKVVQRQVPDLGEIDDTQREAWCRLIEAFEERSSRTICGYAPSITGSKAASKRTSSSPSWLTACTSPCARSLARLPPA
jgi:hypothetical protein